MYKNYRLLLLVLFLLVAACRLETPTVEESIAPTVIAQTAVSPTPTPTITSTPLPDTPTPVEPTAVPTSTTTPTATATLTPEATSIPVVQVTAEAIFSGGNVRLVDWSPNGRYLTYFAYSEEQIAQTTDFLGTAEGTFTIYDTNSGTVCEAYPLDARYNAEGSGLGRRHLWLPNGDLFIFTQTGEVIQTAVPCGESDQNLTSIFAEQPLRLGDMSPNKARVLLNDAERYWIYDFTAQTLLSIPEVMPDSFNNLAWSPNGHYLAINLAGRYAEGRDPVGGTRIVDTATGEIIARHDWEPMNAIDGSFGGPVWVGNEELLITVSLDQGPFFMTLDGDVRLLTPLFPSTARDIPNAHVFVEPDTAAYHILLNDFGIERPPLQIYHSNTDSVETLETEYNFVFLRGDGYIVDRRDDGIDFTRHITAVGEPFHPVETICATFQFTLFTNYYVEQTADQQITLFQLPNCNPVAIVDLGLEIAENGYVQTSFGPNDAWVSFIPRDEIGRGTTLFLLPLANVVP